MFILLSPAKSLDYEAPLKYKKSSDPVLLEDAASLINVAKALNVDELMQLMKISLELAQLNMDRFKDWSIIPDPGRARPAVFAFNGDVYDGLNAKTLSVAQLNYLQNHLRILSGLYGLLRPLDLIQAYRLEMGSRLINSRGKDLYAFWGDKVTYLLNDSLSQRESDVVINLASEEYFKVIRPALLKVPVITPVFKDYKNGNYKIISFFAKRARGLMTRYCAMNKISNPEKLKQFDLDGYLFSQKESDDQHWVFKRRVAE